LGARGWHRISVIFYVIERMTVSAEGMNCGPVATM
jgi:hypothetical protein